jgi:hypothetical protein
MNDAFCICCGRTSPRRFGPFTCTPCRTNCYPNAKKPCTMVVTDAARYEYINEFMEFEALREVLGDNV